MTVTEKRLTESEMMVEECRGVWRASSRRVEEGLGRQCRRYRALCTNGQEHDGGYISDSGRARRDRSFRQKRLDGTLRGRRSPDKSRLREVEELGSDHGQGRRPS
jgi:hypothetical protein